jgi:hypothetical protein
MNQAFLWRERIPASLGTRENLEKGRVLTELCGGLEQGNYRQRIILLKEAGYSSDSREGME